MNKSPLQTKNKESIPKSWSISFLTPSFWFHMGGGVKNRHTQNRKTIIILWRYKKILYEIIVYKFHFEAHSFASASLFHGMTSSQFSIVYDKALSPWISRVLKLWLSSVTQIVGKILIISGRQSLQSPADCACSECNHSDVLIRLSYNG